MIKVAIIGGTGYTGQELVRILCRHPRAKLEGISARSGAGQNYADIYTSLRGFTGIICEDFGDGELIQRSDVGFAALPHGLSGEIVPEAVNRGKRVIDLGADFRFSDERVYEEWYGAKHPCPAILKRAVYGLPELKRNAIVDAAIVGNPGCYPTCSILALTPLLKEDMLEEGSVIIDAKSGISGEGRSLRLGSHFCECNESVKAYSVAGHRHTPETEEQLSAVAGKKVTVTFTPHLVPMQRGMLVTAYGKLKKGVDAEWLRQLYIGYYQDEYFVRVMKEGVMPTTGQVRGSNFCDISLAVDQRAGRVIVCSVIDNLVKGASGQAVQNMNIIFGFDEKDGLDMPPLYL
ncbi:MAG: N-acetyl-gamma-glutamyl-phosphate reductase [Clostridiales bacterium]|nr:N-acetyl-gamma-glutamyl-phosphate reductase [Clostridiales bacterium]